MTVGNTKLGGKTVVVEGKNVIVVAKTVVVEGKNVIVVAKTVVVEGKIVIVVAVAATAVVVGSINDDSLSIETWFY